MKKSAIALAVLAVGTTLAFASPEDDREHLMKAMGKSMGELGKVAKGESPFEADAVLASLKALNDNASKLDVAALFPEGSASKGTSPKIWENFDDFKAHAEKLKADVAAAVAAPAADAAALGPQLGMIGKDCGGCHELYRIKKD
ncbi:MAG: cytochrome c [Rhizobiales bacterium]|nr:cytochrome c [Hyphomicrobiales bacterium]